MFGAMHVAGDMPADGWPADACSWQRRGGEGARLEVAAGEEAHDGSAVVHAAILFRHPLVTRRSYLHPNHFHLMAPHS